MGSAGSGVLREADKQWIAAVLAGALVSVVLLGRMSTPPRSRAPSAPPVVRRRSYSVLSDSSGSVRSAFRAGSQVAAAVASTSTARHAAMLTGS